MIRGRAESNMCLNSDSQDPVSHSMPLGRGSGHGFFSSRFGPERNRRSRPGAEATPARSRATARFRRRRARRTSCSSTTTATRSRRAPRAGLWRALTQHRYRIRHRIETYATQRAGRELDRLGKSLNFELRLRPAICSKFAGRAMKDDNQPVYYRLRLQAQSIPYVVCLILNSNPMADSVPSVCNKNCQSIEL